MKYYTYVHYRKDTMEPFYVGKGGVTSQYQVKTGRSKKWEQAVAIHDFIPMKMCFWNTEQEAYDHEEFLISCFRDMGYNLCNSANGGKINKGHSHDIVTKEKMRQSKLGISRSNETKQKLREYNLQPEIREQIAARFRGKPKPKYECTICGKQVAPAMLKRWHNDNCKLKNE